jgi:NAD-dependent SIR2 family protein deacetylase
MMTNFEHAARQIAEADALIITAGAGMGVDSGLPDFRGDKGFWEAYPALHGYSFAAMANPQWFYNDPHRAWGFYGHRLNLYRDVTPHEGFQILRQWASQKNDKYFIFTSNVDGQFQKAGFSDHQIVECHGSIHHVQDLEGTGAIWSADDVSVDVDERILKARDPLPRHPSNQKIIRPNILMFGDGNWNDARTNAQERRYNRWLNEHKNSRLVVIEMGAGTAIPTVRNHGEFLASRLKACLIRINPRETEFERVNISSIPIGAGAKEGLTKIQEAYNLL